MPRADVERVPALAALAGADPEAGEVVEVARRARRAVVVVARHRAQQASRAAPRSGRRPPGRRRGARRLPARRPATSTADEVHGQEQVGGLARVAAVDRPEPAGELRRGRVAGDVARGGDHRRQPGGLPVGRAQVARSARASGRGRAAAARRGPDVRAGGRRAGRRRTRCAGRPATRQAGRRPAAGCGERARGRGRRASMTYSARRPRAAAREGEPAAVGRPGGRGVARAAA